MKGKRDKLFNIEADRMRRNHINNLSDLCEQLEEKWLETFDTKYMAQLLAAMEDMRDIAGADAPERLNLEGSVNTVQFSGSQEELKQLILTKIAEAKQKKRQPPQPKTEESES